MTPSPVARNDAKTAAVRKFLRSLNILLKSCRLYGIDHSRTSAQLKTAWDDLFAGLKTQGGLQIAVSGPKIMIDGTALKASPAESSFAEMLSAAGISSIEFSTRATQDEFQRFVRGFAASGSKFEGLSGLLKEALGEGGSSGIKVNEYRVVAADAVGESGQAQARVAGEAMARALGAETGELKEALADPQKLLALIAAAEGMAAQGPGPSAAGPVPGATAGAAGPTPAAPMAGTPLAGTSAAGMPAPPAGEADEAAALRMLVQLGKGGGKPGAPIDVDQFRMEAAKMPLQSRQVLQQALAALANELPKGQQDPQLLLKLAERLAIRIAMKRFERGDAKVDAVHEMLNRMAQEIDSLRKKLAAYEEKPRAAEADIENLAEGLERKFWAILPDDTKLSILLSPDAFNIPIHHILHFLAQVPRRGDLQTPRTVLGHYAEGVRHENAETRRRVTEGITHLTDLYAAAGNETLELAIAAIGTQLLVEEKAELQNSLGSVLVHLSQLAADGRYYGALKQVMVQLNGLTRGQPQLASALRARIGMESRVPHLIEEALRKPTVPEHLLEVLKEMPREAALQAAYQFNQATEKERSERVIALAKALGPDTAEVLRETLRSAPDSEALVTVGLLTRLEISVVGEHLAARLPRWNHFYQHQVVNQVASSAAPGRGELLAYLMDRFDPFVLPPAVDEIGLSGDVKAAPRLVRIAGGELPVNWPPYLRIKAIEALGRLGASEAVPTLRNIVQEKKLWIWAQPRELRVVALQALRKIDPQWAEKFAPDSGLTPEELALAPEEATSEWAGIRRQRCYERIAPRRMLKASLTVERQEFEVTIVDISLGGAFAMGAVHLPVGTRAELRVKSGPTTVHALTVLLRGARKGGVNFEIVDIDLEERSKLRRMLVDIQKQPG